MESRERRIVSYPRIYLFLKIKKLSEKQGRSISSIINDALSEYFLKHK